MLECIVRGRRSEFLAQVQKWGETYLPHRFGAVVDVLGLHFSDKDVGFLGSTVVGLWGKCIKNECLKIFLKFFYLMPYIFDYFVVMIIHIHTHTSALDPESRVLSVLHR